MADRRYNCIARRGRRNRGLQGSRGAHGHAPAAPPAGGAAQSPAAQKPARKRWLRALCILLCVLLGLGLALFGMQVGVWAGNAAADRAAAAAMERAAAYADTDLSSILSKEHLTVADYELIYRCTGLTRAGVDRCLAQGEEGKDRILQVQRSFCASYGVRHTQFGFFCVNDYLDRGIAVATAFLENGDILVTPSVRLSGLTMGHAGLVTDAEQGRVLQAIAYGWPSDIVSVREFTRRPAFMILSPRTDAETKKAVAAYAAEELVGIPYDITAGVLSDKNSCNSTQCAHIIWYAYAQFGLDIDGDGGLVVTPHDFAISPQLEVVQVYGFDLDELWQ